MFVEINNYVINISQITFISPIKEDLNVKNYFFIRFVDGYELDIYENCEENRNLLLINLNFKLK